MQPVERRIRHHPAVHLPHVLVVGDEVHCGAEAWVDRVAAPAQLVRVLVAETVAAGAF
jgi:hypothetical protein